MSGPHDHDLAVGASSQIVGVLSLGRPHTYGRHRARATWRERIRVHGRATLRFTMGLHSGCARRKWLIAGMPECGLCSDAQYTSRPDRRDEPVGGAYSGSRPNHSAATVVGQK